MKATILLVCVLVAGLALVFWLKQSQKPAEAPNVVETPTIRPDADQPVVSNQSIAELRNLLVADYHSTNEHDAITSALTHELIAERLRTNAVFLDWASNVTKSVILRFVTNGSIPVYGSSGLTADSLQLCKVTANGMVGMYAEAVYAPNTTNEGPLEFIVEGGVHPTRLRVQNSYRLVSYQLSPERWARSQRKIGRMDWSGAVQPLDKEEANTLSRHAFREMTGLDLDSFHLGKTKIDSERIRQLDGIIVPGGFGERGVEGMIAAARIAREHNIPYLGICLGMQVMVIEFARHVLGLSDAHSTEISLGTSAPVIALMAEQMDVIDLGGTMRLGACPAMLEEGSLVAQLYGATVVSERHRHRYEFNSRFRAQYEASGMRCSGTSPDGRLVEFVEVPDHAFFVGTQAHPEFKSRPDRPHPLFLGLIKAADARAEGREPHIIDPLSVNATL